MAKETKDNISEFLSGGLAITETPPHPAPRLLLKVLMVILIAIVTWAILGKTEIVAIASGTIIPSEKSKIIQVFDRATVKKFYVRDGDHVKKGDILMDLEQGMFKADLERIMREITYNKAQIARVSAFLKAIDDKENPIFIPESDIPKATAEKARERLMGDYENLQNRLAENRTRTDLASQEINSFKNAISQRQNLLNIKQKRQENFRTLAAGDYIPKNRYLEIQEDVVTLQNEMGNLKDKIAEKNSQILALQSESSVIISEARNPALQDAQEARRTLSSLEKELEKAEINMKTTRLIAPISGTVQQLTVNTVGGILTPAQPVMVIVPEDGALEAEVTFFNKDIGFIKVGQEAHIKIESFPYTKYGMIDGTVSVISGDAVEDEKLGFIYKGRVRLKKTFITVGDKKIPLVPGMTLTAEVKTDTKRLIEYFLSPIMTNTTQAFRER